MEASVETGKAIVAYLPSQVTTEQIAAAIEDLGFGCELESEPEALKDVEPGAEAG